MLAAGRFHFKMEDDQQLKKGFLRALVVEEIRQYHPNIEQAWMAQDAENERIKLEKERLQLEPLKAAAMRLNAERNLSNQNLDGSNLANLPSLVPWQEQYTRS